MYRFIRELKKPEYHAHLDDSLRLKTMIELSKDQGVSLPSTDPKKLHEMIKIRGTMIFEKPLERFKITLSLMQSEYALERVARELCEDLAEENVTYLEVRYCPYSHLLKGLFPNEVIKTVGRGLGSGKREYGVEAHQILCCMREHDPQESVKTVELAKKYRDLVVGIDLAGNEVNYPPQNHKNAFELAKIYRIHRTVHAGEMVKSPKNIRTAINELFAERVGHAIALRYDRNLMEEIKKKQIFLELCPTSNVQASFVNSYEDHPIREFMEADLKITVNTDNRMFSNTTVTDEWFRVATVNQWSQELVKELIDYSFKAKFG